METKLRARVERVTQYALQSWQTNVQMLIEWRRLASVYGFFRRKRLWSSFYGVGL